MKTDRDKKARKNLINLIVKFAYFNESQGLKVTDKIMSSFGADKNSYISIGEEMGVESDFRFCQLSMYGASLKSAQKISCKFLADGLQNLKNVQNAVKSVPSSVGDVVSGNFKKIGF